MSFEVASFDGRSLFLHSPERRGPGHPNTLQHPASPPAQTQTRTRTRIRTRAKISSFFSIYIPPPLIHVALFVTGGITTRSIAGSSGTNRLFSPLASSPDSSSTDFVYLPRSLRISIYSFTDPVSYILQQSNHTAARPSSNVPIIVSLSFFTRSPRDEEQSASASLATSKNNTIQFRRREGLLSRPGSLVTCGPFLPRLQSITDLVFAGGAVGT